MDRLAALISREEYEERAGPNLAKARWHKPVVRPIDIDGIPCLVKDYLPCPLWFRLCYGRSLVSREAAIYRVLEGIAGIPRFLGRIDAYALVVERIEGRDLKKIPPGGLPPRFLERLAETVRAMHARGVVHGDLRQRRNILIGPDGTPCLIDFVSGVRLSREFPLFDLIRKVDLSAIAKLKARHAPESLSREERRMLAFERYRPFRRRHVRRRQRRKAGRGSGVRS